MGPLYRSGGFINRSLFGAVTGASYVASVPPARPAWHCNLATYSPGSDGGAPNTIVEHQAPPAAVGCSLGGRSIWVSSPNLSLELLLGARFVATLVWQWPCCRSEGARDNRFTVTQWCIVGGGGLFVSGRWSAQLLRSAATVSVDFVALLRGVAVELRHPQSGLCSCVKA
jgi:hypothetical protein